MGKETIKYWKSANDIIVVNYSVHSNNQEEYAKSIKSSKESRFIDEIIINVTARVINRHSQGVKTIRPGVTRRAKQCN